jgi:Holliday junction resolvase RusA-like endonuclease
MAEDSSFCLSRIGELMKKMKRKLRKLEKISERKRITKSQEERYIEYTNSIVNDKHELEPLLIQINKELNIPLPTFERVKEYKYQVAIHEVDNVMKSIHDKNKMCSHEGCKHKAHFGKDTCLDHSIVN